MCNLTSSIQVDDWYSPLNSPLFTKTILTMTSQTLPFTRAEREERGERKERGKEIPEEREGGERSGLVVIDGSELGDVLVTSRAEWVQGVDTPDM